MSSAAIEDLKIKRAALVEARSAGVTIVRHGDKWVHYRSIEEIRRAIEDTDAEIAALEGRRRRIKYADARKGL